MAVLGSVIRVLTTHTPLERARWYRRVAALVRKGTPVARALRCADIACEIDRALERHRARRWRSDDGRAQA